MKPVPMRRTRFLSTLGPATDSEEMISALMDAGADCFRINMSHAKHEDARETVRKIRRLAVSKPYPIGVLFDLTGPSIRTGTLETPYQLKEGDQVEFRTNETQTTLPISTTVNYGGLLKDVSVGNTLIVDNGSLIMEIESISEDHLIARNKTPGELGSRRHINLPIAQVVSKLEDQEAIRNLDDIIEASDVIMVARGDLGIEVHIEELPILQRKIVKRCHEKGRRVIVATHLLESMISNPTPTRAEVTDVANAVFEEADVLMVSGETSIGKYPIKCLEVLNRVARRIERSGGLGFGDKKDHLNDKQKTVRSAIQLADSLPGAVIAVFTRSGATANHTSLLRPRSPIFALTGHEQVRRHLTLSRGVRSFCIDFENTPRLTIAKGIAVLRKERDIAPGTPVVVISDTLLDDRPVNSVLLEYA